MFEIQSTALFAHERAKTVVELDNPSLDNLSELMRSLSTGRLCVLAGSRIATHCRAENQEREARSQTCLSLRRAQSTFALPVSRRRDSLDADLIRDTCYIHP